MNKLKIITTIFCLIFFTKNVQAVAVVEDEIENPTYNINLDQATIAKGYTVSAFDDGLKLSLVPGILSEDTDVEVMELNEEMTTPWQLEKISKIYQFEFKNKVAYDEANPFYIQFSYDKDSDNYKQVYFYDKNYASWRPLPTQDFPEENFVRSLIHLPFARIAVFEDTDVLTVGKASWYAYKGGDFAASPDFPKGSILRVTNTENEKFVDVEINDYGPDRSLHPDRVVDLDKVAFAKIASLGEGIIDVSVEPLYIEDDNGEVLGISETGASDEPEITSISAIIMSENDEDILWQKNATTTRPLASLTKLVAVKTFFNTRPSLDTVVAYDLQDEEYNYQYCNKWESARVRLNEGDTLTIEDLVYSSLVGSANNTIESLVRVSGLKRDEFIEAMNDLVIEWGASSTHFYDPTGLDPENVSSAQDYAIITKKVFENPIIQKASVTSSYTFLTINTEEEHKMNNTNQLIRENNLNITGSKTGYLHEALYCLMVRVDTGNDQLIVVTMGAETRDVSFDETEELIEYGLGLIEE